MWPAKLHHESRTAERHQVATDATLRTSEDQPVDILIADVSATGCLFVCSEPLEINTVVSVGFAGLGRMKARIIRVEGTKYGAEFTKPLAEAALAPALSAPRDGVIPLQLKLLSHPVIEQVVSEEERWPIRQRLIALSMMAATSWGVMMVLRLLF